MATACLLGLTGWHAELVGLSGRSVFHQPTGRLRLGTPDSNERAHSDGNVHVLLTRREAQQAQGLLGDMQ